MSDSITPARRAQILRMIRTIHCAEELEAFRSALREAGELRCSDVLAALRDRQDALHRVRPGARGGAALRR